MRKRILIAAAAFVASAGLASADTPFPEPIVTQQDAAISAGFGPRADSNRIHPGVDVAAPAGAEVHVPARGRVLAVHAPGALAGYHGQVVEIDHGDSGRTRFSNLDGVTLTAGADIEAGAVIGRIAANEHPHVHVELWRGGHLFDPALQMALIGGR